MSIASASRRLRYLLAQVKLAVWLGMIAALLRLLGVRRATNLIFAMAELWAAKSPATAHLREARQLAWRTNSIAPSLPGKPRCLVRSLAIASILRRHGIPAAVMVGVTIENDFVAHAWVEVDGTRVSDPDQQPDRHVLLWKASE